jgi:hypothetical protein
LIVKLTLGGKRRLIVVSRNTVPSSRWGGDNLALGAGLGLMMVISSIDCGWDGFCRTGVDVGDDVGVGVGDLAG